MIKPPGNSFLWANLIGPDAPKVSDRILYVGIIPSMLVIFGVVNLLKRNQLKNRSIHASFLIMGLFCLIFAFGPRVIINKDQYHLPFYLLLQLPGFSGTRVPLRFAILIYLALGVAIATAFFFLEKKHYGLKRIIVLGIGMLFMLEYLSFPLEFKRFPDNGYCPPVYQWLAKQQPGPIIEIPLGSLDFRGKIFAELPDWASWESEYQYYSRFHFFPMMNGYSGFFPPLHYLMTSKYDTIEQLPIIKAAGVKYIIYHKIHHTPEIIQENITEITESGFRKAYEKNGVTVFKNTTSGNLPYFSFLEANLSISDDQQFPALSSISVKMTYGGKTSLVLFENIVQINWYQNNNLLRTDRAYLLMNYPIVRPNDTFNIVCNTPENPGSYKLQLIFHGNVTIAKTVEVL
ncbi:MAG: hypothetical protein A2Y62_12435 [Candidatus Fischerbacteria bacterium RBG_13_37_8]|uniref:Uncharacterized protein n=1 Tax=Candidatus Fischerbacteria bacterium RBG_13_37_8 TaxID=1817863 RepID=A0A1F5VSQ7_9BACT|nr:MAG: hypothetical protein A2Y62_12435 [Candidatus Fischerbacteria bacterium RBG_13_37_8]